MKKAVYFLLFMATFFAVNSCKEDEGVLTPHAHEESQKGYKRSTIGFAEMKAKLSSHPGKTLSIWGNKAHKGGEEYIQEIDTTHIIQFSNDTLTTYTMRVRTLDEENYAYSNLIIRTLNGEIEEFIAHYTPTAEWQEAFNNGENLDYEGIFKLTDINGETIGGDVEGKGSIITCTFSIEPNLCYGQSCPCTDGNGVGYNVIITCSSAPTGGGGGGGNNNGGGTDPDLPTDPTGGPWGGGGGIGGSGGNHTNFDFFVSELSEQQVNWLNANPTILAKIYNYLEDNNYDYYSHNFAKSLIELVTELNYIIPTYTTSNYPGKNDGMLFNWWKNENYLNNMSLDPYDQFKKLTKAEKILVSIWPQQAYQIFKNKSVAEATTTSVMGYNGHNDRSDAFRHAFFNAINTRDIWGGFFIRAADIVRLFGEAHESEVPAVLNKEKIMDLHNNDSGINYTAGIFSGNLSNTQIVEAISYFLVNGSLWYLNPLDWNLSPPYDANNDGNQDCPNCLNGITSSTIIETTTY